MQYLPISQMAVLLQATVDQAEQLNSVQLVQLKKISDFSFPHVFIFRFQTFDDLKIFSIFLPLANSSTSLSKYLTCLVN